MFNLFLTNICTLLVLAAFTKDASGYPFESKDKGVSIRIVHTNDMHSRFEEISSRSTSCTKEEAAAGKCYGGFARIATLVREARNSTTPTLFLNAGDNYQDTFWYTVHKWKIVSRFMNLLAPDAMCLGNHEFDDGVQGLIPFIQNATFPVLATNLDLRHEPALAATKLKNSTVITINGTKIGVIGYVTPETKILAKLNNVIFKDEIQSIREEAKKLKSQGVNIIIALGHSGYETDKKIAKEIEDIDIVIGGHTNTFLYNGKEPDLEKSEGPYPTVVVQDSGRKVYVTQAYAYTKYLGNFTVTFNNQGEVTHIEGNPILVNSNIKQAPDVLAELENFRPAVENVSNTEIGRTLVLLDGDSKSCRRRECNMGNFITDATLHYNAKTFTGKTGWTDVAISVVHSGSIRTSITRNRNGKINVGDVLSVLPFGNFVVKVTMDGETLLSMLEHSVSHIQKESMDLAGGFLQVSGLQIVYDISQPPWSRIVSVQVQCATCRIPIYKELEKNETYKVLMDDFMLFGGDGYSMLTNLNYTSLAILRSDVIVRYLKSYSPIHTGIEWRINYLEHDSLKQPTDSSGSVTYSPIQLIFLLPIVMSSLLIR